MTISVGIPFIDDRLMLELAVRSVFAQSFEDWELLLVDDGSRDGSLEMVRGIRDARVRVLTDGQRRGLPARLNEVARESSGDLMARMDSDDAMHPDRLTTQHAAIRAHADVDVVASRAYTFDTSDSVYGIYNESDLPRVERDYLQSGILTHPTVLGRTSWFRDNPYDETLLKSQDKDLWCRTRHASKLLKLERPLLFYRLAGRTRWDAYQRTCHFNRRVLRRWGPEIMGRPLTFRGVAASHAKELVMGLAFLAGQQTRFESRRSQPLTNDERSEQNLVIKLIHATPVPGWPSESRRP